MALTTKLLREIAMTSFPHPQRRAENPEHSLMKLYLRWLTCSQMHKWAFKRPCESKDPIYSFECTKQVNPDSDTRDMVTAW